MPIVFAALCLPIGFAVAQATGIRPLGGVVLAAMAVAAVVAGQPGAGRTAAFLVMIVGLFAVSHALAGPLGTWGAVAAVAALATLAGALLL